MGDISQNDSLSGKLFVGGISWNTTEDVFADYFSQYGEIVNSVIMRDRYSGKPRGFGFVTYADPTIAEKVLEKNHVIDGRAVEVKKTFSREDMAVKEVSETKKIFVGGLALSLTENELEEYFSSYGKVVERHIMVDPKYGRSRGFGFVMFETQEAVERVLSWGKMHELGGKHVEIRKAEPRRHVSDHLVSSATRTHSRGSGRGRYSSRDHSDEKIGRGYDWYGDYDYYGSYTGGNAGYSTGFYCGYGGYGYGFGLFDPMYGAGYGVTDGYGGPIAGYGSINRFGHGSNGGGAEIGRFHPYRRH